MDLRKPVVTYRIQYEDNDIVSTAYPRVKLTFKNANRVDTVLFAKIEVIPEGEPTVLDSIELTQKISALDSFDKFIDLYLYYDVERIQIKVLAYLYLSSEISFTNIAELCESTKSIRYSPLLTVGKQQFPILLKAFCNFPGEFFEPVYACWEYSSDGKLWKEYPLHSENSDGFQNNIGTDLPKLDVNVQDVQTRFNQDLELEPVSSDKDPTYVSRTMYRVNAKSSLDSFYDRIDAILVPDSGTLGNKMFRIRMCTVRKEDDGKYFEDILLSTQIYTPLLSNDAEFLYSEIKNVSKARGWYYGSILYMVGAPSFKNNLIASLPGENVFPISQITPLNTLDSTYVTCITPWKDYLIAHTTNSTHLVSRVSEGYTSKTINASIGIPYRDSLCNISCLNGVIFKSENTVYMLYPNIYAGEDSVLNLTDISKPVRSILEDAADFTKVPFAFGTDTAYFLMLPYEEGTKCLVYNYSTKVWTVYTYDIVFTSFEILSLTEIHLFGFPFNRTTSTLSTECFEYLFNATIEDIRAVGNVPSDYTLPYADYTVPVTTENFYESASPIFFSLDSGQKTDSLNFDKQFVESKFNVVTLHDRDTFPMLVSVHVDGNPHVSRTIVNTDSAFWKTSTEDKGILGTDVASEDADIFNVFRQMYLRHSGKGRSVRYIVEGESIYPFKLYEINYRYRNLNTKH